MFKNYIYKSELISIRQATDNKGQINSKLLLDIWKKEISKKGIDNYYYYVTIPMYIIFSLLPLYMLFDDFKKINNLTMVAIISSFFLIFFFMNILSISSKVSDSCFGDVAIWSGDNQGNVLNTKKVSNVKYIEQSIKKQMELFIGLYEQMRKSLYYRYTYNYTKNIQALQLNILGIINSLMFTTMLLLVVYKSQNNTKSIKINITKYHDKFILVSVILNVFFSVIGFYVIIYHTNNSLISVNQLSPSLKKYCDELLVISRKFSSPFNIDYLISQELLLISVILFIYLITNFGAFYYSISDKETTSNSMFIGMALLFFILILYNLSSIITDCSRYIKMFRAMELTSIAIVNNVFNNRLPDRIYYQKEFGGIATKSITGTIDYIICITQYLELILDLFDSNQEILEARKKIFNADSINCIQNVNNALNIVDINIIGGRSGTGKSSLFKGKAMTHDPHCRGFPISINNITESDVLNAKHPIYSKIPFDIQQESLSNCFPKELLSLLRDDPEYTLSYQEIINSVTSGSDFKQMFSIISEASNTNALSQSEGQQQRSILVMRILVNMHAFSFVLNKITDESENEYKEIYDYMLEEVEELMSYGDDLTDKERDILHRYKYFIDSIDSKVYSDMCFFDETLNGSSPEQLEDIITSIIYYLLKICNNKIRFQITLNIVSHNTLRLVKIFLNTFYNLKKSKVQGNLSTAARVIIIGDESSDKIYSKIDKIDYRMEENLKNGKITEKAYNYYKNLRDLIGHNQFDKNNKVNIIQTAIINKIQQKNGKSDIKIVRIKGDDLSAPSAIFARSIDKDINILFTKKEQRKSRKQSQAYQKHKSLAVSDDLQQEYLSNLQKEQEKANKIQVKPENTNNQVPTEPVNINNQSQTEQITTNNTVDSDNDLDRTRDELDPDLQNYVNNSNSKKYNDNQSNKSHKNNILDEL